MCERILVVSLFSGGFVCHVILGPILFERIIVSNLVSGGFVNERILVLGLLSGRFVCHHHSNLV
jgi:hypothetical protein